MFRNVRVSMRSALVWGTILIGLLAGCSHTETSRKVSAKGQYQGSGGLFVLYIDCRVVVRNSGNRAIVRSTYERMTVDKVRYDLTKIGDKC